MQFGHKQFDVYKVSIRYVAWAYGIAKNLKGVDRHARDQLLRASQSIPLNIAEGNGRGTQADRRRFFEIARGSALECAATQDCLEACKILTVEQNTEGNELLTRIVSMLTKLGGRNCELRERCLPYKIFDYDYDYDNDHDNNP